MTTQTKTLSIVIPVFNEEKRIRESLIELRSYLDAEEIEAEVVVVDDGSNDKTMSILREFSDYIRILPAPENRGKGHAVKRGVLSAKGEIILFMDADLATPLAEIKEFLKFSELTNYNYDIMIGSRFLRGRSVRRDSVRNFLGHLFKRVTNLLLPLAISDSQCGFKLFKKECAVDIFRRTRIERWAFDMEALFLADRLDYKVIEIPVAWQEMSGSHVHLVRDGFRMIIDLLAINFYGLTQPRYLRPLKSKPVVKPIPRIVTPSVRLSKNSTIRPEMMAKPAYQVIENRKEL